MPCELLTPVRRLRRKTWLGFAVVGADEVSPPGPFPQHDLTTVDELGGEVAGGNKSVYLVTLPALKPGTTCRGYVCPSSWSHEEVLRVFLSIFEHGPGDDNSGCLLECMVVFREKHADDAGRYHWHIALKASRSFRFAPFKRALHVGHGLASHWSCSHRGYWSAVRYGVMPSPKKGQADLDPQPQPWSRTGSHPCLFEAAQEPVTAAALARRREHKVKEAAAKGKPEPRPTEMDLYAIIVRHGFRNTPDDNTAAARLVAYLKVHGSPALVAFAFKNRAKLPMLIDDVWSWEKVDEHLAVHGKSRMDQLYAAAASQCGCGGAWLPRAMEAFASNYISPEMWCKDVLKLLEAGRRPDVPVLVLMGRFGGEGKSFLLAPLREVFGAAHVQATPQRGSFPLLGLESKKVVILDDWCFDERVIPLPTQLLWYEGKPFPLPRPQNNSQYNGHLLYEGTAPLFVTVKEKDFGPIIAQGEVARAQGMPSEYTMLLRRLKIYSFTTPLAVSTGHIVECARCFAQMVLRFGV